MKNLKKLAIIGAVVLAVSVTSITALAASTYKTPVEIVAGLAGKSVEDVTAERTETGDTYGALATEYGVLSEFKSQMLEQKKTYLDERVAAGTMTREQADTIIEAMEARQVSCDGTGSGGTGAQMGAGFGCMNGNRGGGARNGYGCGLGCGTGSAQD